MQNPKVFVIGMNKTATTSIHELFHKNGYKGLHWNKGRLAQRMFDNISQCKPILSSLSNITTFSDMVVETQDKVRYFHVEHLADIVAQYPDAIYIFNDRSVDSWVSSLKRHANGSFFKRELKRHQNSEEKVVESWRNLYVNHKNNVLRILGGKHNFIHFDIENDNDEILVSFLVKKGFSFKINKLPRSNVTGIDSIQSNPLYEKQISTSRMSAINLLSILWEYYSPKAVIDFGCGVGTWLSAAKHLGAQKLVGLDGPSVNQEKLVESSIDFIQSDLGRELNVPVKFDLAISLQFAYRIHESKTEQFISNLTKTANVIVFSAAIPKEHVSSHNVNDQPQSYWIRQFEVRDYVALDIFRPRLWDDNNVEPCYKQNTFLFIHRSMEYLIDEIKLKCSNNIIVDCVHPDIFRKTSLSDRDVNFLRDTAIHLEYYNVELSCSLMKIASKLRPEGEFIAKKCAQYEKLLGKKDEI
ncbi:sulfotransferase [Vibrio breoganii]